MTTDLRPIGDRILVERVNKVTVSKGGILIPEVIQEKPQEGVVLAVGPGLSKDDGGTGSAPCVEEGDKILFTKGGGVEVKVEGQEYVVLREEDILGVIG